MGASIYPLELGMDHCYVIRDKGAIMVDGGAPGKEKAFLKALDKIPVKAQEIKLLVLTHGHFDHIACAWKIKEMTGAKIAIHHREREWLEKSLKPMPPAVTTWGSIFGAILKMFLPFIHIPPEQVDIPIGDEGLSLHEYGIEGRIIHTPGHSSGSVTVLLDTGEALVGDLAMNKFPLRFGPGMPIFADDPAALEKSWRLLLEQGVKTIYPAHGDPFSADVIREALAKA